MKYLVPFDFTEVSKNALTYAINLANKSGGEILVIHFVEEKSLSAGKEILMKEYLSTANLDKKINVSSQVLVGDFFIDIGKIAEFQKASVVVMGTHGVDLKQKIFGSNAIEIITNANLPFIVAQENCEIKAIKKIVLPFSIETKSMQILRFVTDLAKINDAEIVLIGRNHAEEVFKHKENANVILAKRHLLKNDVKHRFEIVEVTKSHFLEYIIDFAETENADLIATTYFSDSLFPIFEKFIQNLIVNKFKIPVVCLNAQSLSHSDGAMSYMTN
jgi:nucleotide-binding universal stress UspA family protein